MAKLKELLWKHGKVYDFQEMLELCYLRQVYIDHYKALSGSDQAPWVPFNTWFHTVRPS